MTSSGSDHARIILESSAIVSDASSVFGTFSSYFGMSFFVAGAVFGDPVAPRNVNDVSNVMRINHDSHFWRQEHAGTLFNW